ncbi:MAG: aminoglycoside 6-adenylyltransferase [Lentilactobacillus diolivorans]|uniref:aminoglycoside 6-adenylyltransferase n=1 Tax=Lentilactobacillus diolivorans TaxID=179838 RepID=UPI0039EB6D1A
MHPTLEKLIQYAKDHDFIEAVGTEGSINNAKIHSDPWQDIDVTYFSTDLQRFRFQDWWPKFGTPTIWQHFANNHLFGKATKPWNTYLVRFDHHQRIDLKIAPLSDLPTYLRADSLNTIVWRRGQQVTPRQTSAKTHFIGIPTQSDFENSLNEFYWTAGNVVKGLARHNLIYANETNNQTVRPQLLRMLAWRVSIKRKGQFDAGANYKFLANCLSNQQQIDLFKTYRQDTLAQTKASLLDEIQLMRVTLSSLSTLKALQIPAYVSQAESQLLSWLQELPD